MKKVKDLKPTSQTKLRNFSQNWWIPPIGPEFSEQNLNSQMGIITSALLPSYFLHYAIEADDIDLVEDLCANGANGANGANVNQIDECYSGTVPLQLASDLGRSTIVKTLLAHGAKTEGIEVKYTMDPCTQPLTFMWGIKELALGRTVDYGNIVHLLNNHENHKQKCK